MSGRHLVSGNLALNVILAFIYLFSDSNMNSINFKPHTLSNTPIKHSKHTLSVSNTSNLYIGHLAKLSLSGPSLLSLSQPQSSDLGFK